MDGVNRIVNKLLAIVRNEKTVAILISTALSAAVSGVLATLVSSCLARQQAEYELKHDVLQRIAGNRYVLTNVPKCYEGEPFIALNEAYVVYADDPEVIAALKKYHAEMDSSEPEPEPDRNTENLLSLVKAMNKAADVPATRLDDDFFKKPFTPQAFKSQQCK